MSAGRTYFRDERSDETGERLLSFAVIHRGNALSCTLVFDAAGRCYAADWTFHSSFPVDYATKRPGCQFIGATCWCDGSSHAWAMRDAWEAGGKRAVWAMLARDFEMQFGYSAELSGEQLSLETS